MAPMSPVPVARSVSSRMRSFSAAVNVRRLGRSDNSGLAAAGPRTTVGLRPSSLPAPAAAFVSATLLGMTTAQFSYALKSKLPGGLCLTIIGTEGLALADEDVRCLQVVAEQLAQGPDFRTAERMGARQPVLAPSDMQKPLTQIHLVASQADQFRNAQSMPVGDQNHRGVPVTMASKPPGRSDQPVDLDRGQVFPAAALGIGLFGRRSHGEWTFPKTISGTSVADAVRATPHLSSEQVTFPKRYEIGKVRSCFLLNQEYSAHIHNLKVQVLD